MKKLIALLLCTVLLCGCAPKAEPAPAVEPEPVVEPEPALSDCGIIHEPEFGGVYITSTIEAFNALGFDYGDSVNLRFSNGYELTDLPYYNGYYTENGEPLLIAYPGYDYIKAAINNGDDLWTVAGLSESDTATVTLCEQGKYLDVQRARDIHYTDLRSDYPSDEVFANFRAVRAGEIAENTLYRSASPCDNQHNRAHYVDDLAAAADVRFILDLADNEDKIDGYVSADDFNSPWFLTLYNNGKVEPLALNMNFASDEFKQKIVKGLTAMAAADGPYLVHCTEGKDRTGFVCMLLEALAGATYAEIVDDYMITYDNYYKINPSDDKERYDVIVDKVLDPMIRSMAGDPGPDLKTADLSACAVTFLTEAGMDAEQIETLRHRLTTTPEEIRAEAEKELESSLTGRVVTPIEPMFRTGEPLPDGVYSVAFSADDWYYIAGDGTPMLRATFYDYDRYDPAEIASLQRGDQVQSYDELFTVEELKTSDAGGTLPKAKLFDVPSVYSLYGNHNLWLTPLLDEEQEEYYRITEHDYDRFYPVGTWDLPVDPDFTFVDGYSWVLSPDQPQVREPDQGVPYTLDELREQVDQGNSEPPWYLVTSEHAYTILRLQVKNGTARLLLIVYHE